MVPSSGLGLVLGLGFYFTSRVSGIFERLVVQNKQFKDITSSSWNFFHNFLTFYGPNDEAIDHENNNQSNPIQSILSF